MYQMFMYIYIYIYVHMRVYVYISGGPCFINISKPLPNANGGSLLLWAHGGRKAGAWRAHGGRMAYFIAT